MAIQGFRGATRVFVIRRKFSGEIKKYVLTMIANNTAGIK